MDDQPPLSKGSRQSDPAHPAHETGEELATRTGVEEADDMKWAPVEHGGREGFLPIETNTFDRLFISVVILVAIHLLWMRFVEMYLPLWVATVLSVALGVWIVRRG